MTTSTAALNSTAPLISPRALAVEMPPEQKTLETVDHARSTIRKILSGQDKRLLVIAGPCSIHNQQSALEYASKLARLHQKYFDRLYIIMRVYFEKPRTTVGWKGLINDPEMDGSCDIASGLKIARQLLLSITSMGLPAGMEMLYPMVSQYIGDLASWASIGARTSESQVHREMASGLSMPVGFKNATDGSLEAAVNSIKAAASPQCFLSIDRYGQVCVARTSGNNWGHLILRGGKNGPNYDSLSINNAQKLLLKDNLNDSLIVDCSHMNAGKKHMNQITVCRETMKLRSEGNSCIRGLMIESNLQNGNQEITCKRQLKYGVSVTDECIGWDETEKLLEEIYSKYR